MSESKKTIAISLFSERTTRMFMRGKLWPLLRERYNVRLLAPPMVLDEFKGIDQKEINERPWPDLVITSTNHPVPTHLIDNVALFSGSATGAKTLVIQHFLDSFLHFHIFIPNMMCCWGPWFYEEFSSETPRVTWIYNFIDGGYLNAKTWSPGMPKDRLAITGSLNHDFFFDRKPKSREKLCEELGFDPKKPIVLNLPIGIEKDQCHEDITAVCEACLEFGAQLIMKPHPMDYKGGITYREIMKDYPIPWKVVADPGFENVTEGIMDYNDPIQNFCGRRYLPEAQHQMMDLLTNADVTTSVGSTANLEGMIFDTPIVLNATGWAEGQQFFKRWSLEKYYRTLREMDCVDIADGRTQYKRKIQEALENPEKKSEQRKKAVERLFYKVDGKAYERVFGVIEGLLGG